MPESDFTLTCRPDSATSTHVCIRVRGSRDGSEHDAPRAFLILTSVSLGSGRQQMPWEPLAHTRYPPFPLSAPIVCLPPSSLLDAPKQPGAEEALSQMWGPGPRGPRARLCSLEKRSGHVIATEGLTLRTDQIRVSCLDPTPTRRVSASLSSDVARPLLGGRVLRQEDWVSDNMAMESCSGRRRGAGSRRLWGTRVLPQLTPSLQARGLLAGRNRPRLTHCPGPRPRAECPRSWDPVPTCCAPRRQAGWR